MINNNYLNNEKDILLFEVALTLNKELFDEKIISYKVYKFTEEKLLKQLSITKKD